MRVLSAMSGGVDSSVATARLIAAGHQVTGVHLALSRTPLAQRVGSRGCCSLADVHDARRVADRLGIDFYVWDFSERFADDVIGDFLDEYAAGRTPNPCQACNARVRFPELARLADRLGCALVATGHYARCVREDGGARLRRGLDPAKDQAYFLYGVGRELLPRVVFPLGWAAKTQVRAAAAALGLPVAAKRESQEICFVPENDRAFLFAPAQAVAGEIVDRQGRVLGRHRGLVHYTVGQRRGLGVSAAEPLYVLALDPERNRLVVGPARELGALRVACDRFVAAVDDLPPAGPPPAAGPWLARIRHRHAGAPVTGWRIEGERLTVELAAPARGVAPGQALVLYRDDLVLGGGRIVAAA